MEDVETGVGRGSFFDSGVRFGGHVGEVEEQGCLDGEAVEVKTEQGLRGVAPGSSGHGHVHHNEV